MAVTAAPTKLSTNPFVGPRSFQTGERLYGRTREGAELVDLLIAERIVLLYSPSGAGKSSLINAVIIPQMLKEGFRPSPTIRVHLEPPKGADAITGFNRYSHSVMRSLEEEIPVESQCPPDKLGSMRLAEYIQDYRARAAAAIEGFDTQAELFLIFDQFEEVIRVNSADTDAKSEFFAQLGEMLRDRSIWALIAIREDYLAALEPYTRPIPNRFSATYRVDFLDARAAVEAIEGPTRDSGMRIEEGAAAQLANNLRSIRVQQADGSSADQLGPYVEPVQLQVVCRRLWEKAAASGTITLHDVSEVGNIDDALSDYYTQQVSAAATQTGVDERELREWIDRKLITLSGIRGQVLMEPDASGGLSNDAIKALQEAYLVRADKRGNATWFELAHDRLTQPIRHNNAEWFKANLNTFQRQADLWNTQGRLDALLLPGQDYLDAQHWAKEHSAHLKPEEQAFLEACAKEYASAMRARRMNFLVQVTAGLMTLLAVVAVIFYFQARNLQKLADHAAADARKQAAIAKEQKDLAKQNEQTAKTNERIAKIRELAAQSLSNLVVDPELSISLGLQAVQDEDLAQGDLQPAFQAVQDALRQALPAMRTERILSDPALGGENAPSHAGIVWDASYNNSGTFLATAGEDGTVKVWNTLNGKLLKAISVLKPGANIEGVTCVDFSQNGRLLAAGTSDGRILLYETTSWNLVSTLPVPDSVVRSLAFSPDSKRLLSGSSGGSAAVWDVDSSEKLLDLTGQTGDVEAVEYSPLSTQLATGDSNGLVVIYDAGTGNELMRWQASQSAVSDMAFRPEGKTLATAGGDAGTIVLWDLTANGKELITVPGHKDVVESVAFTADGTTLISVSADRTVRFWDSTYGRPGMVLYGHKDKVFGLALSPDRKHIATTSKDGTGRIWNISPEGSRESMTLNNGAGVNHLAISPDGKQLAAAGEDGVGRVWSVVTRTVTLSLLGHTGAIEGVVFSRDGTQIATASVDQTARLWDAATGKELAALKGHTGTVWDLAFKPDGKQLATASQDETVKIWDVDTQKIIHDLPSRWGAALAVEYSPNGELLAAGYSGGQVVLWNPSTGKQLRVLDKHTGAVEALSFSPDGNWLASAGDDGNIIRWSMDPARYGDSQAPIRGSGEAIFDVTFDKDGTHLFFGGADGIGTMYNLDALAADFRTYGHTDRLYTAEFSPDGAQLYTSGRDGTIRQYASSFQQLLELARKRDSRQFTQEECRQYLQEACSSETVAPPAPGAPATLNQPGDPQAAAQLAKLTDPDSSKTAAEFRANGDDIYGLNRFERPFSAGDMKIYYPDIDIVSARLAVDDRWIYVNINMSGLRGDSLSGYYAFEVDLNRDGRGDYLISALAPGTEWSTSGVAIWQDKNRDVGGEQVYYSDPPQKGDGYETVIFDQGSGDVPDLAWSRISPTDPKMVQVAFKSSLFDSDTPFAWWVWASRDLYKPGWFNYHDHFTQEEAGSPLKDQVRFYPLKALAAIDNSCRVAVGFPVTGQTVYCQTP